MKLVNIQYNEELLARYNQLITEIKAIGNKVEVQEQFKDYFEVTSKFVCILDEIVNISKDNGFKEVSLEELKELNTRLFDDIVGEKYDKSYANPTYGVRKLGECGQVLSMVYARLRNHIEDAYACNINSMIADLKLYVEIYNILKNDSNNSEGVKNAVIESANSSLPLDCELFIRKFVDKDGSYHNHVIENYNLNELNYLYMYDSYITKREIEIAEYFRNLSEKKITSMARTCTQGFIRGYENANLDLSIKKYVRIYYAIGFEKMAKKIGEQFEEIGLTAVYVVDQNYFTNRQYKYDHRNDRGLYLNEEFSKKQIENYDKYGKEYFEYTSKYAGPAVIETFGEENFEPQNKTEAISLSKEQQRLASKTNIEFNLIYDKYYKKDETSFTIISYPTPEIGEKFQEIFDATVEINNLDNDLYANIQQCIIDALDKGDYVHVLGKGENKTDIKVNLFKLNDPSKETIFENCRADVNIPVGEVFTSPVLKDTNGVLHVTEVFLNGFKYKNLKIELKDGMIADYTCDNFDSEEENKKLIKEKILYNNETVPIGEFAIGTNTTAYVVGQKYNIQDKLTILIAEKTGPHFAMGDTCYSMMEDNKIYNPDGKEIVAKENECSALRKTDTSKAYFGCHTDITIPYNELGEIAVYTKLGEKIVIIQDGRFVLKGTEKLNEAFDGLL